MIQFSVHFFVYIAFLTTRWFAKWSLINIKLIGVQIKVKASGRKYSSLLYNSKLRYQKSLKATTLVCFTTSYTLILILVNLEMAIIWLDNSKNTLVYILDSLVILELICIAPDWRLMISFEMYYLSIIFYHINCDLSNSFNEPVILIYSNPLFVCLSELMENVRNWRYKSMKRAQFRILR